MTFGERLRKIRTEKGLTQVNLSKLCGISSRMIQTYESRDGNPKYDAVKKLAAALEVPISELLGETELLVAQAGERYGARGAKQAKELTDEVAGLFSGGELAEEDMEVMMRAISEAYWIAKEKNKKYAPKRRKHE